MQTDSYEIERKFLIRYPDLHWLAAEAESSEITQTYLLSESGSTARVRKRAWADRCVYTHTVKRRVTDMRRIEREREISEEEYVSLLDQADPQRKPLRKTRYCLLYQGQTLEVDLFPFWTDRAYLEIELTDEAQPLHIPPEIRILREVTGDKRYTNAALAREVPQEASAEET